MITIRAARAEEIAAHTPDILCPLSLEKYAAEKDGEVVAYLGVATTALSSFEGYPWFHKVREELLTERELVRFARAALDIWSQQYDNLYANAEKGVNEAWFRFLGFVVDREDKPIYADGKTLVHMRYNRG